MAIQLINHANSIEVSNTTAGYKETFIKGTFRTLLRGDIVTLAFRTQSPGMGPKPYIELRYGDITVPAGLTSAALVYALIVSWDEESAMAGGVADAGFYIGKPTNGDFVTAYLAGTTITLSDLPPGISAITDEDIEVVRQINVLGDVVETFYRIDGRMTVAANVLTVTGAVFAATDTFVVFTNIPRSSISVSGGATPDWSNAKSDFAAVITNATKQIIITSLPHTLTLGHVLGGFIKKVSAGKTTDVIITDATVSGYTITCPNEVSNFVTGDIVWVWLDGPTKNRDSSDDVEKVRVDNADAFHFTDEDIIVNVTNATVDQHYSPEIFPASFKYLAFQFIANAVTGAAGVAFKMWATLNPDAATPADLDATPPPAWFDMSAEALGAATVTLGTADTESEGYAIDSPTKVHRYIFQYDPGHATNIVKIIVTKY